MDGVDVDHTGFAGQHDKAVIRHKMDLFNCVGAAKYYRDPVTPQWRQDLA